MFNVDLMNSTGLQKIISKGGTSNATNKQKITFQDESASNVDESKNQTNESGNNKPASFVSILVAFMILGVFLFFGLINVNEKMDLTGWAKYLKPQNHEIVAKSTAIKFLSNPKKSKILTSIDINENLVIKFKTQDISDYKLTKEDSKFFMVYDDRDTYNASFQFPLKKGKNVYDKDIIIKNLIMKYKNSDEVFLNVEDRAIYFIGPGKDIYEIMESLFGSGDILIEPGNKGEYFTLKYSY